MEGILTTFGIDWKLISIQIFNFALLAAILWYFLYTPVLRILREREEKIAQGVKDADAARDAKASAEKERRDILSSAETEAEEVGENARQFAKKREKEIIAEAESKASLLVLNAKEEAEVARESALRAAENDVAKAAILAAEKILREKQS